MNEPKDLILRPIPSKVARDFIRRTHYSGKVTQNSQVHFGAYINGELAGALQYGPPLDRRKMAGLIIGGKPREMLELNRMAFTDALPRNSESRAIAVSLRLIKRHVPHIRFIISFADGTQCGDGTIYRAAGFHLTSIKPNSDLCRLPSGEIIHSMTLKSSPMRPRPELGGRSFYKVTGGKNDFKAYIKAAKAEVVTGYQLRYLKLLDPTAKLAVPSIPYAEIAKRGASMYLGKRPTN